MKRISRRTALRGVLGGSSILAGVPLLESMGVGRGQALAQSLNPTIFGIFFWGGGIPWTKQNDAKASASDVDIYTPRGDTGVTELSLSELLKPLEESKAHLNVVTGLNTANFDVKHRESHYSGQTMALTGDGIAYIDRSDLLYTYSRASIDRVIAKNEQFYGDSSPFLDSVQITAIDRFFKKHSGWNTISMDGPDQPAKPIYDAKTLYQRLLGNVAVDSPEPDTSGEHYASVLDAVIEDAKSLRQKLGRSDQLRLDRHLEGLFEIETRLEAPPLICEVPGEPTKSTKDVMATFELQTDILVAALRCGVTRVFSHMLSGGAHPLRISKLGIQDGPGGTANHGGLHAGDRDTAIGNTLFSFTALNYLLKRLESEESPTGGTLLQNSMIYATSEYATGWHHKHDEFPVILAGSAGGRLQTGKHIRTVNGNLCDIHLTMLQALGLDYSSWGWNGGETSNTLPILT